MIKREINHGNERGRETFYTATTSCLEAMNASESFVKSEQEKLQRSSSNKSDTIQYSIKLMTDRRMGIC
ncbi:MAG: hypothetical protein QW228_04040 [Candidatus Aenigmatarchaeota archaeon]